MTGSTRPPGQVQAAALSAAIAEIGLAAGALREARRALNDETLSDLAGDLAVAAAAVAAAHGQQVGADLAEALAGLMSDVRSLQRGLLAALDDPDFGRRESVAALRSVVGGLALAVLDGQEAAGAQMPRPGDGAALLGDVLLPDGLDRLPAIEKRLKATEDRLRALLEAGTSATATTSMARQQALLAAFVGSMRAQIAIGRLQIGGAGRKINLSGLARVAQAMASLTESFWSTLEGWKDRVAPPLRAAGRQVVQGVMRVVAGVKAIGPTFRHRAAAAPAQKQAAAPLAGFDLDEVRQMILRGEAPPKAWVPFIDHLNFDGTPLINLQPLAGLVGLQRLDLDNTQVSDLAPLAGISGLQTLLLSNTQVSDLAPLAGISGLQELWLTNTQVSDLAPLAGISGLQRLYLNNTQLSDLAPLAGIKGLRVTMPDGSQRQF
jgi:hypothetical protein